MEQKEKDVGKIAESVGRGRGEDSSEMLRVTDLHGEEYLCPASALGDRNFVSESEKASCYDYNTVSARFVA